MTGLSSATPMKIATTPTTRTGTQPSKASAHIISAAPTAVSTAPPSFRRRSDDSRMVTSSRIAAIGGTLAARRAGRYPATRVTTTPTAWAAAAVRLEGQPGSAEVEADATGQRLQPLGQTETQQQAHRGPTQSDHQRLFLP